MLVLTESAQKALSDLMAEIEEPCAGIRVFVRAGGCSGFEYDMAIEESKAQDDMEVSFAGGVVLVDPLSLEYLADAVMDYVSTPAGMGFRFTNPKATSSCSCGKSFSTEACGSSA